MLTKFSENLEGKLAEQWIATVLTPAFAFWCGGLLVIIYRYGWGQIATWFTQNQQPLQLAILVVALLGVAASGQIMGYFDHALIRFLEGYWPPWLHSLRSRLTARQTARYEKAENRFQTVSRLLNQMSETGDRDPALLAEFSALDWSLRRIPALPEDRMPTKLGNRLRVAERISFDKYGLDSVVCWPRLWLLLPDGTQAELSAARQELDAAARLWLWGMLFILWTVVSWWAAPIGILVILLAHRRLLNAAELYGELVESAFDLYRQKLYEALRWPLPQNPAQEREKGIELTAYLWRGSDQTEPAFIVDKKS